MERNKLNVQPSSFCCLGPHLKTKLLLFKLIFFLFNIFFPISSGLYVSAAVSPLMVKIERSRGPLEILQKKGYFVKLPTQAKLGICIFFYVVITRRTTPPKFSKKGLCKGFEILHVALSYQKIAPLKKI